MPLPVVVPPTAPTLVPVVPTTLEGEPGLVRSVLPVVLRTAPAPTDGEPARAPVSPLPVVLLVLAPMPAPVPTRMGEGELERSPARPVLVDAAGLLPDSAGSVLLVP